MILFSVIKEESSTVVTKKKVKLENEPADGKGTVSTQWENGTGNGKWNKFPLEKSNMITEALRSGQKSVTIEDKKATVSIQFDTMVQRNVKTGWEKQVRCVSSAGGYDPNECEYHNIPGLIIWPASNSRLDNYQNFSQSYCTQLHEYTSKAQNAISWHTDFYISIPILPLSPPLNAELYTNTQYWMGWMWRCVFRGGAGEGGVGEGR